MAILLGFLWETPLRNKTVTGKQLPRAAHQLSAL